MKPGSTERNENRRSPEQPASQKDGFAVSAPAISMPKGGGAIRGMGEKFAANPVTGTGSLSVPIYTSPGRAGFGPKLALSYDSASGNGPFGFGWSLAIPAITRKTDRGLPRYRDGADSDVFLFAGVEDLVPELDAGGAFIEPVIDGYRVRRYRPRIEGAFSRIERWTRPGDTYWRSISRDNVTTVYGRTDESRIVDPADPTRIFSWLLCESYDDKGNALVYEYAAEDSADVRLSGAHERNRTAASRSAGRYLKRIQYGNQVSRLVEPDLSQAAWLFQVVFDYGEDHQLPPPAQPAQPGRILASAEPGRRWRARPDPFSSYRAGFEVRTYRRCHRVLMFHRFRELHPQLAPPLGSGELAAPCLVRSTSFDYADLDDASTVTVEEERAHQGSTQLASFLRAVTQSGYVRDESRAVVEEQAPGGVARYFTYHEKSLPPLELEYSQAAIQEEIHSVDAASLENLPTGLGGGPYQWVDLDGEGLSGVLTEQGGAWFYKRNLSALPRVQPEAAIGDPPQVRAAFAPVERLRTRPSPVSLSGGHQLLDLAGDGRLDVARFDGPTPGFFERTAGADWDSFRPFTSLPRLDWRDPNLKLVDVTGDGRADVLVSQDAGFTWYRSLGEEGFEAGETVARALDEERGPHLVFADSTQSVYLADMSGDGLTDIVRIRNGQICYWPSLGYGRFGAKVTMDGSPWFDRPDLFDHRRIRLADIDGSGTTDVLYLGSDGVDLYFNRSGNGWTPARRLRQVPPGDNLASITTVDLLGNGTACLVWSSPLPGDARQPMRYVDLMGGQKPHLLVKAANNLGAETEVRYAPSTRFYLADKLAGTPWITKLPFPVHCVEKVIVTDKWRNTRFASTYSYHHGYFDGVERELRGFGRVEQVDVESFGEFAAGNAASPYVTGDLALYQPPIKTITWFHTGAAFDRRRILTQLAAEYFPNSLAASPGAPALVTAQEKPLPEPDLESQDLSAAEWREALRACKGMVLRQEIYELDVDRLEAGQQVPVRLFSTATHNCHIRRLQPMGKNEHAVFLVLESEALTYHYELDLRPVTFPSDPANIPSLAPDPRVAHTLNLSFDEHGNVQQSIAVGYPRARPFTGDGLTAQLDLIRGVQREQHVAYTETHYTGDAIEPATGAATAQSYRLRVPCDVRTYELTGIAPPAGATYFELSQLRGYRLSDTLPNQGAIPVGALGYHQLPTPGTPRPPEKREVGNTRTLFFADDPADPIRFLKEPLALGKLGRLGLPYEQYKLAFTRPLLDAVFTGARLSTVVPADGVTPRTVVDALNHRPASGYLGGAGAIDLFGPGAAGQYWIRSGTAGFASDAARHFYLPEAYVDPFGNVTTLAYDGQYRLFIQSSKDAADNLTRVTRFDWRVLAAAELEDANGNLTEARFDALGMVVAVALKGKGAEADDLDGYTDELANPAVTTVLAQFDLPSLTADQARARFSPLLGNATSRFLYHFGEGVEDGEIAWASRPPGTCAIVREQHAAATSPLQVAFECSDGSGAVLMRRSQAEPETAGGDLRWIVSGKTVLNNKGKPVKQYEPYFSTKGSCCAEGDAHEEAGVTPLLYYDAAGRLVRTERPDGTFSRVEFSPWHVERFDANDTVEDSRWYDERKPGSTASAEDQRAARLARKHHGTPTLTLLDGLGREVITVAHNRYDDGAGAEHDERHLTFTRLDAEGNPLWIRDARNNLVMQYIRPPMADGAAADVTEGFAPCHDMAGNLLFQYGMDSGDRWTLGDAAGMPMFAWDGRGDVLMSSYDQLHRPTRLELKNAAHPGWIVVGLTQYGEGTTGDQANNRRGESYRSFDQSGVVTSQAFDFKGNVLRTHRRLAKDYEADTDWRPVLQLPLDQEPDDLLMPETFTQLTTYDALDRVTRQYHWHRAGTPVAVYEPLYDARGLLVAEDLTVGASKTATGHSGGNKTRAIQDTRHDAKGQRLSITYGNGVTTRYTYDPSTFRLLTLVSTRPGKPALQDLRYTYDPSGNITEIFDAAVPTEFFDNTAVEPRKRYTYDALYRLIEATGREHRGQLAHGAMDNWNDCPYRVDYGSNDSRAWRNYVQRYTYDGAGNILVMQHVAPSDTANSWTRQYQYAADSNRLLSTGMGAAPANRYATSPTLEYRSPHDVHGNMTSLPHLPTMDWDFTDHLRHISRAPASRGTDPDGCPDSSLEGWYRYDATRQRTRKRVAKQGGLVEERLYLGGLEWYRRTRGGVLKEEIETLHLFDGKQRLLVVDRIVETDRAELGARDLYRYTLSNHLGSSTVELDEQADVISCEEYHPYGTTAYQSGRNAAEVKLKRCRYTGMERDEESGLSYHGARYYVPSTGRWVSCDPAGLEPSLLVYEYARNNPVRLLDPDGRQPLAARFLLLPPIFRPDAESHKDAIRVAVGLFRPSSNQGEKDYAAEHPAQAVKVFATVARQTYLLSRLTQQKHNPKGLRENDLEAWKEKDQRLSGKEPRFFTTNPEPSEAGKLEAMKNLRGNGSQVNAVRHTLGQAMIVGDLGIEAAKTFARLHEEFPDMDTSLREFTGDNLTDAMFKADTTADLLNNEIGQGIGRANPKVGDAKIALATLKVFAEEGLWVATYVGDNKFRIDRTLLPEEQYKAAQDAIAGAVDNVAFVVEVLTPSLPFLPAD